MTKNLLPAVAARAHARLVTRGRERGDAIGWVLIAVMTAGLIAAIWATLGPQLKSLVQNAISEAANTAP